MSCGTSNVPTWVYILELIIGIFFSFVILDFNHKYYYWNICFWSNGIMNFGRAYVLDTFNCPKFEFSSWPYLVNEIGSYWIVTSMSMPRLIDLNLITPYQQWLWCIFIFILIFILTFFVPYNYMNMWHSRIAAYSVCCIGFPASFYYFYLNGGTFLEIACFISFILSGGYGTYVRFFMDKSKVIDRSNKSRWKWNVSMFGMNFFNGLQVLFRQ